jgi:hypothetical protein
VGIKELVHKNRYITAYDLAIEMRKLIVAWKEERHPLLGNGCVNTSIAKQQLVTVVTEGTHNNRGTIGGGVFCAVGAEALSGWTKTAAGTQIATECMVDYKAIQKFLRKISPSLHFTPRRKNLLKPLSGICLAIFLQRTSLWPFGS